MQATGDELRKLIRGWGWVLTVVGGFVSLGGALLSHRIDANAEPKTALDWLTWLGGMAGFLVGGMIAFGGFSALLVLLMVRIQKWRAPKTPPPTSGP